MLTTNQKGAAATRLGIEVYRPIFEGGRFDLVFAVDRELLRVQCKWATRHGEIVAIRTDTNRRGPGGMIRTVYSAQEIDAVVVYCAELDACISCPPISWKAGAPFTCASALAGTARGRPLEWLPNTSSGL